MGFIIVGIQKLVLQMKREELARDKSNKVFCQLKFDDLCLMKLKRQLFILISILVVRKKVETQKGLK